MAEEKKSWGNLGGQIPSGQVFPHLVQPQSPKVGSRVPESAPFLHFLMPGSPAEGLRVCAAHLSPEAPHHFCCIESILLCLLFFIPSLATACSALGSPSKREGSVRFWNQCLLARGCCQIVTALLSPYLCSPDPSFHPFCFPGWASRNETAFQKQSDLGW